MSVLGGGGRDQLIGGTGRDRFHFDADPRAGENVDAIADFVASDDTIMLARSVFSAVGRDGTLAADAFFVGTAAADGADRIVYNQATGALYHDPDGSGSAAQILFARVSPETPLTAADFVGY